MYASVQRSRVRWYKDTLRTTGNATVDLLCTTWVIPFDRYTSYFASTYIHTHTYVYRSLYRTAPALSASTMWCLSETFRVSTVHLANFFAVVLARELAANVRASLSAQLRRENRHGIKAPRIYFLYVLVGASRRGNEASESSSVY